MQFRSTLYVDAVPVGLSAADCRVNLRADSPRKLCDVRCWGDISGTENRRSGADPGYWCAWHPINRASCTTTATWCGRSYPLSCSAC
ncbi:hypothetical protein GFS60_05051 [Rhodococcus sp. WAY2]|nr:hypothetical protein GFS60_05051 [Rhodococcus sp. WAY2]